MESTHDWRDFIDGPLFSGQTPWQDDPAFQVIVEQRGLRERIGGPVTPALTMACDLVLAMCQFDIRSYVACNQPARGLCLGIGMNELEPYDLLHALGLDAVHACEWVGEHIVGAATMLQHLRQAEPDLPKQIRLQQATISDLSFLPTASVHIVYSANLFTWEVPMAQVTFERGLREIRRVLATGGLVFSKGSAGELEKQLSPYGRMLLPYPPVTVFQKTPRDATPPAASVRANCP